MKFMIFFILIFLLSPSFLNAASNYIGVTQTTSKNQLRDINSRFKSMNLKMLYKTSGERYLIYSGPYKTSNSITYAIKKIKRYFPNAKILNYKAKQIPSVKVPVVIKTETKHEQIKQKNNSSFYIGTAFGYSSAPSTHTISEGSVTIQEPNNSGINYIIDGGYNFENGFSLGLAYMKFDASDLVFDNMYGIVNYRFGNYKGFTPYFGALAGFSSLKWSVDPISVDLSNAQLSDKDSSSFIGGTQAGVMYTGIENISLLFGYKCIITGHTTNIKVDTDNISKLEHNALHTLQLGIQYNF